MTKEDLVSVVSKAIQHRWRCVIGNHNSHSLYLCGRQPEMRAFYSLADYIHVDGMSIIRLGQILGLPLKPRHRTQYIDLLPSLAKAAAKHQWRVYYLGSKPGVADRAAQLLRDEYPGLQIVTRHGYFDPKPGGALNQAVLADIRQYAPDLLMVGMGMPRQEVWVAQNLSEISANVICCCGGMMDLVAGEIPLAPRWLGPLGFEWLFRLCTEPVRLWRRYLLEPWMVLIQVLQNVVRSGQLTIIPDSAQAINGSRNITDKAARPGISTYSGRTR